MRFLRTLAAMAALLLLTGCLPVLTQTPVGTTAGLANDPALYGVWKGKNPDDKDQRDAMFHFMRAKDGGFDIVVVMAEGGADDGWTALTGTSSKLGQNHFLNVVMTYDKAGPVEGRLKGATIALLYRVEGRTLTLYQMSETAAKAAIKSGQIQGTIAPGDDGDVTITAGAQELDAFLAKPEAVKLFQPMLVLRKAN